MKKYFNLLLCLALALHLNACTSNDAKDESEDGVVAEDSIETESADAALESDGSETITDDTTVAESNDGFLDEQLPEDALGESSPPPEVAEVEPVAPTEEPAMTEEAPMESTDTSVAASESPVEETPAPIESTLDTNVSEVTSESPSSNTDSFAAVDTGASTAAETSSVASTTSNISSAPLRKVEPAPMTRSGVLLNGVYLARPGDSFSSISKAIYGNESKTKELKKVNPYFSKVRPGDKVYYNSPVRPTDDTKMLTFYEDSGMIPETYVAKEGDNIREVSKNLLGYDNAWKEIWTTNTVESKGTLTAGTELRYWKTVPVAAPPMETAPAVDIAASTPPPPPAMNELPPPPAMNEMPPPPTADMPADPSMAAGTQDLPPPPPPAEAMNPPPPPPAPMVAKQDPASENIGGLDNDMIMTLGGAGILIAAIALLIIVRKRRQQKEMSSAFSDTHVGT